MLNLSKPLVFFDLEGTGVDPYNDRIIQIAAIKFFPNGQKTEHDWVINPGVPIPPDSTEIHGFTDAMVKDKPYLGDLAADLSEVFFASDLGGYNVKYFDIPMLQAEFNRIGLKLDLEEVKIVDAMAISRKKEPRTLAVAYQKYCGQELANAHHAMADTKASIEVLCGQMKFYDDIPATPAEIHAYCFPRDPNAYDVEGKLKFVDGQLTINFGKNKGRTLQDLSLSDPGYLEWIMNGSFSEKVKGAVRGVMK